MMDKQSLLIAKAIVDGIDEARPHIEQLGGSVYYPLVVTVEKPSGVNAELLAVLEEYITHAENTSTLTYAQQRAEQNAFLCKVKNVVRKAKGE